ncbi:MAG: hypothetical protein ACFCUO_01390 [Rhodospirillales bacterium]
MTMLTRMMLIALLAAIVAGAVFLATAEIPAPVARVEKIVSNDRFPR